jgi:hypothetical protein
MAEYEGRTVVTGELKESIRGFEKVLSEKGRRAEVYLLPERYSDPRILFREIVRRILDNSGKIANCVLFADEPDYFDSPLLRQGNFGPLEDQLGSQIKRIVVGTVRYERFSYGDFRSVHKGIEVVDINDFETYSGMVEAMLPQIRE